MGLFSKLLEGSGKGLLDGVGSIISKFKADPTKVMEAENELEKLKLNYDENMKKLENELEAQFTQRIQAVNATMQTEAKSEHWMQWSWRPAVGFLFIAICLNNYVVIPYVKKYGVEVIEIPSEVFMAILAILGVASWTRGQEKIAKAKK